MINRNLFYKVAVFAMLIPAAPVFAQGGALQVTAEGVVSTSGPIHVGSTEVPVGQFAITESGIVRFEMIDTNASKRWRFTNAGDKFAINQVDTPGTEFSVFENGNAVLGGVLTENSDVNSKQDIQSVDVNDILEKLGQMQISEWSYKDAPEERHIGPMAQDFRAAFGLGNTDKGIATLDSSGVALAAIQALIEENALLKARLDALETQQAQMRDAMADVLENQHEQSVLTSTVMN